MADWVTISSLATAEDPSAVPDPDDFTRQQLDIYIPAGDSGYWQGALRDASAPGYQEVRAGMKNGDPVQVDLLYGDYEGGQRAVARFILAEWPDDDAHDLGRNRS